MVKFSLEDFRIGIRLFSADDAMDTSTRSSFEDFGMNKRLLSGERSISPIFRSCLEDSELAKQLFVSENVLRLISNSSRDEIIFFLVMSGVVVSLIVIQVRIITV